MTQNDNQEQSDEIQVKVFKKIRIYLADQSKFLVPSESDILKLNQGLDRISIDMP